MSNSFEDAEQTFKQFEAQAAKAELTARECSEYHWQIKTHVGNVNYYPTKFKVFIDGEYSKRIDGVFASEAIGLAIGLRDLPSKKKGKRSFNPPFSESGPMPWDLQLVGLWVSSWPHLPTSDVDQELIVNSVPELVGLAQKVIAAYKDAKLKEVAA